jgi:hypothetical protein
MMLLRIQADGRKQSEEAGIEILEHIGNSPDMNAIEQA